MRTNSKINNWIQNKLLLSLGIVLIVTLSISLKLMVSRLGHNFDSESWMEVSNAMQKGRVVYNTTSRYNYGPIWSYILGGLSTINIQLDKFNVTDLHFTVVIFLSIVDVLTSLLLYKMFGKIPAILFLLNPVATLLTGYHSQIDNVAVLIGLFAWYVYLKGREKSNLKIIYISALILGVSLSMKHILFLFPIWMLFLAPVGKESFKTKIIYTLVTYGVFAGGFIIEILRDYPHKTQVIYGITEYVFKYKSSYGFSVLFQIVDLIFPIKLIDKLLGWLPIFKGYTFIFFGLLILYGYFITNKIGFNKFLLPIYLLAFTAFTPSLADQYFAIVLVPVAIFWKKIATLIFNILTFTYLAAGNSANITNLYPYSLDIGLGNHVLGVYPWNTVANLINYQPQAWILILTIQILLTLKIKNSNEIMRAVD